MATPKLTPYERAVRRAGRAYAAAMTNQQPGRQSILEERAMAHGQVVQHWSDPLDGCTCEGCMAWWPLP